MVYLYSSSLCRGIKRTPTTTTTTTTALPVVHFVFLSLEVRGSESPLKHTCMHVGVVQWRVQRKAQVGGSAEPTSQQNKPRGMHGSWETG